jgi:hypothetical protein
LFEELSSIDLFMGDFVGEIPAKSSFVGFFMKISSEIVAVFFKGPIKHFARSDSILTHAWNSSNKDVASLPAPI